MSTAQDRTCPRGFWVMVFFLAKFSVLGQEVLVEEKVLSNGMRLLLVARPDEPAVAGGWVAHVGSANERPGITGIAHLFEHMLFKGTPTLGTKNYQKDLEIMSAQEKIREEMRSEEEKLRAAFRRGELDDISKPENKSARWVVDVPLRDPLTMQPLRP